MCGGGAYIRSHASVRKKMGLSAEGVPGELIRGEIRHVLEFSFRLIRLIGD